MLFESANNVAWSAIVLLLGASLCVVSARLIGMRPLTTALLYTWHTGWAIFYGSYVLANGGDAFSYFERARFDFVELSLGTQFIIWLTSFPAGLGLGYWPITFVYNTAGATGLVFFYAALRESSSGASHSRIAKILVLICTLLPSLSFWTSGIGKDFNCLSERRPFVSAALHLETVLVAPIAVLIMLPVRPHIAVLMVLSVGVGTLFVADLRATARFGMGAIATAAAVFVVPLALIYTGTARFSSISRIHQRPPGAKHGRRLEHRHHGNESGTSTVQLSVPTATERGGRLLPIGRSVDNFMLILLTGIGIIAIVRGGFIRTFRTQSINLLYGLACLGLLSQVTANLGLAARQKWMLVPALMLVIIAAWSAKKENAD